MIQYSSEIFDLIEYVIIEETIGMVIHEENQPLMKTKREIKKEDIRLFWKNLINEGWHKNNPKW